MQLISMKHLHFELTFIFVRNIIQAVLCKINFISICKSLPVIFTQKLALKQNESEFYKSLPCCFNVAIISDIHEMFAIMSTIDKILIFLLKK